MASERKTPALQIGEGYRAARRTTSLLCAVAVGWSAAQFDFKSMELAVGSVDLSHASIPAVLFCAIAFATTRLVLEYAMQSVEVRRWRYAQADFKLSVFLVRASILVLAVSALDRSLDAVLYLILGTLCLLIGSRVASRLGMRIMAPLFIKLRLGQGRFSVASMVWEAYAWTIFIVAVMQLALIVAVAVASTQYGPLRALWIVPPSFLALGIFVVASISILLSSYYERMFYDKIFAAPVSFTDTFGPDGKVVSRVFHIPPPPVWDWRSEPATDDEPNNGVGDDNRG